MENKIKLFLDDIRAPINCLSYMHTRIGALNPIYKEEWLVVRNYTEFCKAVQENLGEISHVSFDHDLADDHYDPKSDNGYLEETGLDCAKFLIRYYEENNEPLPEFLFVHSMNPVGTTNIINLFKQ